MSGTDLRTRIRAFLDARHVLTLATAGEDGPWAAAVFYAAGPALELYFISDPDTRHARHLVARAAVAATVQEANAPWTQVQGLQIEGVAGALEPPGRREAEAIYLARFPELGTLVARPAGATAAAVAARFAASTFYVIRPRRIRLIDNTRGFGHREELAF